MLLAAQLPEEERATVAAPTGRDTVTNDGKAGKRRHHGSRKRI